MGNLFPVHLKVKALEIQSICSFLQVSDAVGEITTEDDQAGDDFGVLARHKAFCDSSGKQAKRSSENRCHIRSLETWSNSLLVPKV